MSEFWKYDKDIKLFVEGRIPFGDAKRQEKTASYIIDQLNKQPGIILADEVGMGKTFVALATAVSIALKPKSKPVVIMIPKGILEKWKRDLSTFLDKCLRDDNKKKRFIYKEASHPIDFLKLLDLPAGKKPKIIFLTHRAFGRSVGNPWVKLAFIRQSMLRRKNSDKYKLNFSKMASEVLYLKYIESQANSGRGIWKKLLNSHPKRWHTVLYGDGVTEIDDDLVPKAILESLDELNFDDFYEVMKKIPQRNIGNYQERVKEFKNSLNGCLTSKWDEIRTILKIELPLLIFDEAHHLKNLNQGTKSLFGTPESIKKADEVENGSLSNVFERMLFLTATPFQLGHYELCNVLRRFEGIKWKSRRKPLISKNKYIHIVNELQKSLDESQHSVQSFQKQWKRINVNFLNENGYSSTEDWWKDLTRKTKSNRSPKYLKIISDSLQLSESKVKKAERELKPWVIRHNRSRFLIDQTTPRRVWIRGKQTHPQINIEQDEGIEIEEESIAPFLLATRATMFAKGKKGLFLEGLSSTYETFKHTRVNACKTQGKNTKVLDDQLSNEKVLAGKELEWYLSSIEKLLPRDDFESSLNHPKVKATVERAFDVWKSGEKVLIFCFYVQTGRTLRRLLSYKINQFTKESGVKLLSCKEEDVEISLRRISQRLDPGENFAKDLIAGVSKLVLKYDKLTNYAEDIANIVRRYLKGPTSLVRFVPIKEVLETRSDYKEIVDKILTKEMGASLSFKNIFENFLGFLNERAGGENFSDELKHYLVALEKSNPSYTASKEYKEMCKEALSSDEIQGKGDELLVPNVKLANGSVKDITRQKLMLTFNTPFLPEILVASSVMAEGMDLHLNCRHVIHHDLCWNPSSLEQRTGRVDRIGAKAEKCGKPITIYYPYIAATQDEKMYKVVMDREQWFKIVMGEKMETLEDVMDSKDEPIPLPDEIAQLLQFKLSIA